MADSLCNKSSRTLGGLQPGTDPTGWLQITRSEQAQYSGTAWCLAPLDSGPVPPLRLRDAFTLPFLQLGQHSHPGDITRDYLIISGFILFVCLSRTEVRSIPGTVKMSRTFLLCHIRGRLAPTRTRPPASHSGPDVKEKPLLQRALAGNKVTLEHTCYVLASRCSKHALR